MSRAKRVAFVALVTMIGATAIGAEATGGTYDVWTCRAPDGAPAVAHDEAGGWQSSVINGSPVGGNSMVNGCSAGLPLTMSIAQWAQQPSPTWLRWTFFAPAATTVARYQLDLDGYARRSDPIFGDLVVARAEQQDPDSDARFLEAGEVPRQVLARGGQDSGGIVVQIGCGDSARAGRPCDRGSDGVPARANIYRATFTLQDREAPTVSSVSGDAVSDSVWAGSTGISVAAADQGGGVYRLGIEIDGQVRTWSNLAGAPCVSWPGTERTFVSPKPCPATVGGVQGISTADLPEGAHTVRIIVEDAAGNQTTAYGPTTKTLRRSAGSPVAPTGPTNVPGPLDSGALPPTADPGPENGSPAVADARLRARWAGGERDAKTIRYSQRPTLDGQLTTASGQPIRDALIRVTITRDARRSPSFERDSLKTDRDGRFRWKQPAGVSSRSIRLAYHRRLRDAAPAASRTLRLKVKAPIRLRLSRKLARRGDTVRLAGSLVGRPLPTMGKVIELQARNPGGRWITFRTVRARRNGQFTARYRFRNPGPARFQMRVRSRRSGDYPYATGVSPIRAIAVR